MLTLASCSEGFDCQRTKATPVVPGTSPQAVTDATRAVWAWPVFPPLAAFSPWCFTTSDTAAIPDSLPVQPMGDTLALHLPLAWVTTCGRPSGHAWLLSHHHHVEGVFSSAPGSFITV